MPEKKLDTKTHIELVKLFFKPSSDLVLMSRSILTHEKGRIEDICLHFKPQKGKCSYDVEGMIGMPPDESIEYILRFMDYCTFPLVPKNIVFFDIPKVAVNQYFEKVLPSYIEAGYNLNRTCINTKTSDDPVVIIDRCEKPQVQVTNRKLIKNYEEISDFCIKHKITTI